MRVRYVYSACVVVETPDVTIAADPWFTQGLYDGSWFQYPPLPADPVDVIGPVDMIYVSHIHPDHYDPVFLHRYLERFPDTRVIIGRTDPPWLERKMAVDKIRPERVDDLQIGDTKIRIRPCGGYDVYNIDTALVVVHGDQSVVNLNDNPYDEAQIDQLLDACPGGAPTLALIPYAGAGPYPQTYEFEDEQDLLAAAGEKQERYLSEYARFVDRLKPERAIPFAGQYWLGGPLSAWNEYRGVPDATEAAARRPDVSLVLGDGGRETLDLETLEASAVRTEPYAEVDVAAHLQAIWPGGYDYEREVVPLQGRPLPILPLSRVAYAHAIEGRAMNEPWFVCLRPHGRDDIITMDISGKDGWSVRTQVDDIEKRWEVFIDERYLFGLLTRMYHWNNAEIGSQYRVRRVPDVFRREIPNFLNFLHV